MRSSVPEPPGCFLTDGWHCRQAVAGEWIAAHPSEAGHQIGFHSIPSMAHLHLHVISKVAPLALTCATPMQRE